MALDKLALHAAAVLIIGLLIYRAGRWIGIGSNVAGLASALACLVMLNWYAILLPGWVAALLIPVAILVANRLESSLLPAIVVVAAVAIGGSPVVQFFQVIMDGPSHIYEVEPISGQISHRVDDIVVVVLDEYAGIPTLNDKFDHPTDGFVASLEANGMTVPGVGLSTAASTIVALAEMLDVDNLVPDGVVLSTADYRELYRRMGGDNRFVKTLREAGYHYTHIESGWAGTRCGPAVDTCLAAPWYDLTAAHLWLTSILRPVFSKTPPPFTHAAVHGMTTLENVIAGYSKNGRRDLIFAHVLMPHGPFVLRPDCSWRGPSENAKEGELGGRTERYREQVGCAERLVKRLSHNVPSSAALAVVSDHGTYIGNEEKISVIDWPDPAIAARFNVFMAFRLPPECEKPEDHVTTLVMSALIACAVEVEIDGAEPLFKLVLNKNRTEREQVLYLDQEKVAAVRALLESRIDG